VRGINFARISTSVILVLALLVFAPMVVLSAPSFDFHDGEKDTEFVIKSFTLPSDLKLGNELIGEAVIANVGTGAGTALIELRINNLSNNLYDVYLEPNQESVLKIRHKFDKIGVYDIQLKTEHDSKTIEVNYAVTIRNSSQEPTPPEEADPPAFSLQTFDHDGDCVIGDGEFFSVIDRWIGRTIDEMLFFSAVDAWIGQSSVCIASAGRTHTQIQTQDSKQGILFRAMGTNISELSVNIYALTGQLIYSETTSSTTLRWNLRTHSGAQVANGVYLYRANWADSQGNAHNGPIQKFVLMR